MIAQQEKHSASVTGYLSAHSKVMEIQHEPKWFFGTDTNGCDSGTRWRLSDSCVCFSQHSVSDLLGSALQKKARPAISH